MARRLKDIIIHLDYEDEYKDGKVEVNIIASEPEELVRCKDCENWDTDWTPAGTEQSKEEMHFCPCAGIVSPENHFCSYGERKNDEIN